MEAFWSSELDGVRDVNKTTQPNLCFAFYFFLDVHVLYVLMTENCEINVPSFQKYLNLFNYM